MFIVWGTKIVYSTTGYVADFCPMCRDIRAFALRRVGAAGHVYYITAGQGKLVGYERSCQTCDTAYKAEPSHYISISKTLLPLPALIKSTYPTIAEALAERMELEQKIKQSPMLFSAEERRTLIRTPFLFLSPKVDQRFGSTHLDKEIGMAVAAAIALMFVAEPLGRLLTPDSPQQTLLGCLLLGLGLVVWQLAVSGRRYMQRTILPVLASTLRPLRPTELELKNTLAELRQLGHKMASKLSVADLQLHLKQAPARA